LLKAKSLKMSDVLFDDFIMKKSFHQLSATENWANSSVKCYFEYLMDGWLRILGQRANEESVGSTQSWKAILEQFFKPLARDG